MRADQSSAHVHIISTYTIKPHFIELDNANTNTDTNFTTSIHEVDVDDQFMLSSKLRCDLTPWDLSILCVRYIQKGLLFQNPRSQPFSLPLFLHRLQTSLSRVLSLFYPLAGRFAVDRHPSSLSVSIECNGAGAEFVHAAAPALTVADILAPDVPPVVESFFALTGAVNFDGVSLPLLAVQVTELADGFFIGCSFNHAVGDGNSFWHFFGTWAEICRSAAGGGGDNQCHISRPPVLHRWFPDNFQVPLHLPFTSLDGFIERISPPKLANKFFHFTAQSIAHLKSMANNNSSHGNISISSFQALSAHVWIALTRARGLPSECHTKYLFSIDVRSRMDPPLSRDYFGNAIISISAEATAGDLLTKGLVWAATLIHHSVVGFTSLVARAKYEERAREVVVYRWSDIELGSEVRMGSSPRFDVYGVDFGVGNAVAVRSGLDNKYDGKTMVFPGRESDGSVDLEVYVQPEVMLALEGDLEFMSAVAQTY